MRDELALPADRIFERRHRLRPERLGVRALDQQFHHGLVALQVCERGGRYGVAELLGDRFGIGVAHAERNERSHVAEHRATDRLRQLIDVLVRERETEAILPRLRQNRGECVGGKILELVDEQVEVLALGFRLRSARHRPELELCHEQRAEQVRLVVAEPSLGQVRDEQPPVVHGEGDVHALAHLPQNVSHDRIQDELADLVLDRGDGLALEVLVVARELVGPERADEHVLDLPHHPRAVALVGEHPVHAEERRVPAVEQGRDGVVEDVFEPRSPRVAPDALERRDDAGRDQVPVIGSDVGKRVQSDGEFDVPRVEIHEMIGPLRRDVVQQFLRQIAVRIDDADAMAERYVLQDEVAEQRGLAGAGLADDVEVLALVHGGHAERPGVAPALPFADGYALVVAHGAGISPQSCALVASGVFNASRDACGHAGEVFGAGCEI
jgi:hypothetical protein